MENNVARVMPSSIESEQGVIACMLIDNQIIPNVFEKLGADDFYNSRHRVIFQAITELYDKDSPIDMIILKDYLIAKNQLENAGGGLYISQVATSEATAAFYETYTNTVYEKSVLRRLIQASDEIMRDSYEKQSEVEKVIEDAETKIFNIAEKRITKDFVPMSQAVEAGLQDIEKIFTSGDRITGVPTGYTELDSKTGGLQPGDMVLIAARPSMGKTTFALNLVQNAAIRENKVVAVFSLEMPTSQLAYKLLCAEGRVDMTKLRQGDLTDSDWDNIARASGPLSKAKIFIDDTSGVTVSEMKSKCRRLKLEVGLDMIVIDYLQLMNGRGENRQQEVSEISRSIKGLAKEIGCPVIALSQLSRAPEARNDHRPMLSDLRESGSIEQDADLVMFLYRDEYYNKDTDSPGITELIIAKHRNGEVGTVKLGFEGKYSRFTNPDFIHTQ